MKGEKDFMTLFEMFNCDVNDKYGEDRASKNSDAPVGKNKFLSQRSFHGYNSLSNSFALRNPGGGLHVQTGSLDRNGSIERMTHSPLRRDIIPRDVLNPIPTLDIMLHDDQTEPRAIRPMFNNAG